MPPPPPEATCRICFNTQAEAPEAGRLISPCRCRGTSKYVHSDCLRQWRLIAAEQKNFYECPTCKYQYKLRRLGWSEWIGGTALQLGLTISILWIAVYILGFVADPLLDIYASVSQPYYKYTEFFDYDSDDDVHPPPRPQAPEAPEAPLGDRRKSGLIEHLLKGLSALGLLGFLKVVFFLGPSGWYNFRSVGRVGQRRGMNGGRERIGWLAVAIGVAMFLRWVWQKVNKWVTEQLERMAERVLDIEEEDQETEDARRAAEGSVPSAGEAAAAPSEEPPATEKSDIPRDIPATSPQGESSSTAEEPLEGSWPGGWAEAESLGRKPHQD